MKDKNKPSQPSIASGNDIRPANTSLKILGLTFSGHMNWNKYIEGNLQGCC